jgi:hypothetical protein
MFKLRCAHQSHFSPHRFCEYASASRGDALAAALNFAELDRRGL